MKMHNFYATAKFHIITYLCSSVSDVCRSPSLGPRSSTRRWHFRLRKAALLASAVAFVCATAHHVTVNEVEKLLAHIPAKSSPLDYIPTSLIKSCSPTFSKLIAYLANLSFQEGCFPSSFARAIVTPRLKSLDLTVLPLQTTALSLTSITSQKSLSASSSVVYSLTPLFLPISTLYSQPIVEVTPQRLP